VCSQPEPSAAAEAPVDPAIRAGDARDVAAELLFEGGRPGHELEAEAVVDHGEAAGGERETLPVGPGDILARRSAVERLAGLGGEPLAQHLHLPLSKRSDQA